MTIVRMKVAKSELTFSTPTLAKIAVRAAKTAEQKRPDLPGRQELSHARLRSSRGELKGRVRRAEGEITAAQRSNRKGRASRPAPTVSI